jgi:hypothetical protein
MHGHPTPTLLKALNGLQRRAQEFGQLLLRFSELLAEGLKRSMIHGALLPDL